MRVEFNEKPEANASYSAMIGLSKEDPESMVGKLSLCLCYRHDRRRFKDNFYKLIVEVTDRPVELHLWITDSISCKRIKAMTQNSRLGGTYKRLEAPDKKKLRKFLFERIKKTLTHGVDPYEILHKYNAVWDSAYVSGKQKKQEELREVLGIT